MSRPSLSSGHEQLVSVDGAETRGGESASFAAPSMLSASGLPQSVIARKINRRQAQRQADGNGVAPHAAEAVSRAGGESGAALPGSVQRKFEGSLGADLSGVRVHTGASSAAAANSLGAHAYTTGQNVHFAAGQYDPGSRAGEQLLAHEVAHTVQQGAGGGGVQNKLEVSTPGDALEGEADRAAESMVEGRAAAVTPGSGAGIHRFIADPKLAPGKISDGGHLAVTGRQEAYASDDKIEEANGALVASAASVTLEKGAPLAPADPAHWHDAFGDRALHRVTPVYKAGAPAEKTQHEPVSGDSGAARTHKLAAYKASLSQGIGDIGALYGEIGTVWHEAEANHGGFLGSMRHDPPGTLVHGRFTGRIVALITSTVGAAWAAHETAIPVLNPKSSAELTLKHYSNLLSALMSALTTKIATDLADEKALRELLISLPNDCKQAAMLITGKDAASLSTVKENPAVGDNYFKSFDTNYGWRTHYASVIAKDSAGGNTDNLTFEAAADNQAKVEKGKSLGYFELYGTEIPQQTFEHQILEKQAAYIGRQTDAELRDTKPAKHGAITAARDADHANIDGKLKKLRGEE